MSVGQLVLLDGRREVKFPLTDGLATVGRDPSNDIRITLSSVAPHHATVVVRDGKPLVRSTGGRTLVNGRAVSVAALRPGDVISVGERHLRWESPHAPHTHNMPSPAGALSSPARRGRGARASAVRRSAPAPAAPRDRALQFAIEMSHRASISGATSSSGGKQVAIVQPQRRNAGEHNDKSPARASPQTTSRRSVVEVTSNTPTQEEDKSKRKSPKSFLQNTTKATLWIEQRKTSPRRKTQVPPPLAPAPPPRRSLPHKKSTPLRMTVLKKAQSAHKARVVKIEAPLKIDHTKQAAILLMTGHTPKAKLSISPKSNSTKKSPSYVVKKPSPVRKTPRGKARQSSRRSKDTGQSIGVTPSRGSTYAQKSANRRSSKRNTASTNPSVSILEISDSTRNSSIRGSNVSTRSNKTPRKSPALPSPKKSAMKDHSKKSMRKNESIKFDLSNLEGRNDSVVFSLTETTQNSDEDITLHYSESSNQSQSPSPRRPIHSRSSRMLERVGTTLTSITGSPSRTLTPKTPATPDSPSARRSIRSSAMIQKALETSSDRTKTILSPNSSDLSDRTKTILSNSTLSDRTKTIPSADTTSASAFRTRTLSPRTNPNLESYSVVDLVSFNSDDVSKSVYNSAGSESSSEFGTPPTTGRRTRSTIGPNLGTSTPYVGRTRATRSKSSSSVSNPRSSVSTRRSKSLSTPENKHISVNSTRVSRASRSRSRINDSDLMLLDDTEDDTSPKTSKRSRASKSVTKENTDVNLTNTDGMSTPENRHSPEAAGTPVLSIQSLLDSSRSSIASNISKRKSINYKRKTIGVLSEPKRRADAKSKSIGPIVSSVRKTRLRLSHESDRTDPDAPQPDNEDTVTPRSAVKPSPEAVKNKHSTAKKPQSKRSVIDDLNRSDISKQLFNSPVKRKLSQSMTEFSRRQLFDDEDDVKARRPMRRTIAVVGQTPDSSLLEVTSITPERFVSPVDTPSHSPNMSGLKRLFGTPQSSPKRGGGDSPRATRSRKSTKNDLTDVRDVKRVFAKSPKNDLRRVTGVRIIFQQTSPNNDLTDVRGVRRIFQKTSPENDLRNVSGVKKTIARTSPRNDLTDVRGVRRMFKQTKRAPSYHDVSGIEELYDTSTGSVDRSEALFDMLVGRPQVKAVYSKTFTTTAKKPRTRRRSLRTSVEITPANVDEWIEQELKKRLPAVSANVTKELQRLTTDTVEGSIPIRESRTRNSLVKDQRSASNSYQSSLPIKKRSLPLKKRAIHSTPVKGRVEVTMNASELGRVSPIAVVHLTRDIELEQDGFVSRSTQTISEDTTIQTKTRTPRKQETPKKIEIAKPTPERTPEKPAPRRATRNKKIPNISQSNTKKRRSSLVVAKKTVVISPKAILPQENPNQSPKVESRRTRANRVSIVVPKPSPKMKPQPAAKITNKSKKQAASPKDTRIRKVTINLPETPQKKRSTRAKAAEISPKASTSKEVTTAPAKRGRNTVVLPEDPPQTKRTRKTKTSESSTVETSKPPSINKSRRGKVATPPKAEEKVNKGGSKKSVTIVEPDAEKPTRGRKTQNQPSVETEEKRSNNKSRRGQNPTEIEPEKASRRGKKTETSVQTVAEGNKRKGRGKKTQDVQSPVKETPAKSRGIKTRVAVSPAKESQPRGRGRKAQNQIAPPVVDEIQTTRRRAQNQTVEPVVEEKQTRRGKKLQESKSEPEVKQTNIKNKKTGDKVESQSSLRSESITRRGQKAIEENQLQSPQKTRSRRVNTANVTDTGRKRKAPPVEEVPTKIAKSEPKKTDKKTTSKQNKDVSDKAASSKDKTKAKKNSEETVTETKQTRGRKAGIAIEETTGRGKRKANVEPSPLKVSPAKKPVKERKATRAGASTRNAKGKQAEVTTTVARSRRR